MQFYLVIDRKSLQHEIDKKFFSSSFVHCKSKVTIKYIVYNKKNNVLFNIIFIFILYQYNLKIQNNNF